MRVSSAILISLAVVGFVSCEAFLLPHQQQQLSRHGNVAHLLPTRLRQQQRQRRTSALAREKDDDPPRRPVQDGSPLGVAIVLLGLAAYGWIGENGDLDDSYVWWVFGTASTAAGIARLVRAKQGDSS